MDIRECEGYKKLLKAVEEDEKNSDWHNYRQKLEWIVEKAKEYAEVLGVTPCEMLNAWENQRNYWYMNYYNEVNQLSLKNKNIYLRIKKSLQVSIRNLSVLNAVRLPKTRKNVVNAIGRHTDCSKRLEKACMFF